MTKYFFNNGEQIDLFNKNSKAFHYTQECMVVDLLNLLNLPFDISVLDPCSGNGYKPWFNNFNVKEKYECELDDGNNFLLYDKKVDWVIGNPPYHISWEFTKKALDIANIGVAWLINNQALNSHNTPKRIEYMQSKGFYLQKMHIVSDKRWFGRYYFVIYTKNKNDFLTCTRNSY